MLRLCRLSAITDTERLKCFPGEALLGRRDTESCEPLMLRSRASPGEGALGGSAPEGMEAGLRDMCILYTHLDSPEDKIKD